MFCFSFILLCTVRSYSILCVLLEINHFTVVSEKFLMFHLLEVACVSVGGGLKESFDGLKRLLSREKELVMIMMRRFDNLQMIR